MRVKNKLCTFLLVSLPSLFITSAFATDITVVTAAGYKKPMNEVYTAFTKMRGKPRRFSEVTPNSWTLILTFGVFLWLNIVQILN